MADSAAHLVDEVLPKRPIRQRVLSVPYLVRDPERDYLDLLPDEDDAMNAIVGASTDASDRTYRLAFGPNAGNKALTLQTVPASTNETRPNELVSRQSGFSLHAGVACKSTQRKKLERLWLDAPAGISRDLPLPNNGCCLRATAM